MTMLLCEEGGHFCGLQPLTGHGVLPAHQSCDPNCKHEAGRQHYGAVRQHCSVGRKHQLAQKHHELQDDDKRLWGHELCRALEALLAKESHELQEAEPDLQDRLDTCRGWQVFLAEECQKLMEHARNPETLLLEDMVNWQAQLTNDPHKRCEEEACLEEAIHQVVAVQGCPTL